LGGKISKIQRTRIESQSLGSRLSGISILGFGASWKPPEPERDVVRSILTVLEDKRVLYEDYNFENQGDVNQSLINIRAVLTDGIARVSDKSPAAQAFRIMRAACREFLTQPHSHPVLGKVVRRMIVGPPGDGPQSIVEEPIISNEDNFFAALGKLRGIFGQQLADIAYLYRIDLEEQLASILPPEPKVTISRGTIACSRWTGVSASASSAFENGSEHRQSAAMHGANASRPL